MSQPFCDMMPLQKNCVHIFWADIWSVFRAVDSMISQTWFLTWNHDDGATHIFNQNGCISHKTHAIFRDDTCRDKHLAVVVQQCRKRADAGVTVTRLALRAIHIHVHTVTAVSLRALGRFLVCLAL